MIYSVEKTTTRCVCLNKTFSNKYNIHLSIVMSALFVVQEPAEGKARLVGNVYNLFDGDWPTSHTPALVVCDIVP